MPHPAEPSHHPVVGVALKLASIVFLAGMAASVKALGDAIPAGQTIFFRGLISMLILALVARLSEGLHLLKTRNWRAHAARSLAGSASMFCWFAALTMIPLAQMTAISFTIPLFLTVLAMVFLGERIHAYRWTALAVGFAGVILIVAPELTAGGGSTAGVAIGLTAAVLGAFAQMFLRRMSVHEHALTITFYFSMTSTVFALATAAFGGWPAPTPRQWLLIGLVGLLGTFGQLLMSYSYRYAEASLVAPLDYTGLLFAVAFGFYLFDEIPHLSTWVGAPLVIVAGCIIIWRQYATLRAIRAAAELAP